MKKEIQTLVALQLISLKDSVTIHDYRNNQMIEEKSMSIIDSLKIAIKEGLDIMLPLDEDQINTGNHFSIGTNRKITFIEKMMENQDHVKGVINFLYDNITKQDLEKAHPNFTSNIYASLNNSGISMKKMFELGFDFKQGNFDEESKASSGDLDFFECCLYYKKDFDFSYQYGGDFTLKEAVEDSIKYKNENRMNASKEENLLNFIEKAIMKQKLESKQFESSHKETKPKI